MEPLTLHRRFRPWRYGIGHSQLVLRAHANADGDDHLNVLFEGVSAVKLRSFFQPLILEHSNEPARREILEFA